MMKVCLVSLVFVLANLASHLLFAQDTLGSEVTTIGEDAVEPIEIRGQVLRIDSQPASGSVLRVKWYSTNLNNSSSSSSITADEQGRFRVRLRLKKESLPQLRLSATSADESQMAYFRFLWNQETPPELITIQLVAARAVKLQVLDKLRVPIEKANSAILLPHPHAIDPVVTGADGIAQFLVPSNERIHAVVSWKDNIGLDYRLYELSRNQKADAIAKAPEFPESGTETLILDGVAPVSVQVFDDDGQPLKNVGVYPWLLKKESENDQLNLSMFFRDFVQNTNDEGNTTFAWIPLWQTGAIQFWPMAPGYDRQRGTYKPAGGNGRLEITLSKMISIKGHVNDANGTPVSGADVLAVGAGYSFDTGRASAVTDKDGAYELLVPPDQIYLVVASAKGRASKPHTGFAVFKGESVEEKDFTLRTATRIHGRLIDEETEQPIAGGNVFVYQYGQDLHSMKGVELRNPESSRKYVRPITTYHTLSDGKGQFELFVGDGNFDIRPPQQEKAEKFEIHGDADREFVVKTKLSKQVELTGSVRDKATDRLVAGAVIAGVSRSGGGRDWQATTDQQGQFRVMQFPAATFVHAVSPDKKLGTITEVAAKQPTVALSMQPVGTARGRLLTTDTKEPWGGQAVSFGVRVPDLEERTWSNRFGGRVTTAADGTFELTGLVPGWKYELQMDHRIDGSIPSLGDVLVQPAEAFKLGDVSPAAGGKPYVPPTLDERIAAAFNVKGTAMERYAKARGRTSLVDQHLLIVFGAPDNSHIQRLMKIRFEDERFSPLNDEFHFMAISTDAINRPEADKLASVARESLEDDRANFLLVVFDSQSKKVDAITVDQLLVDGQLSGEKLIARLQKHCPEPKDARKLLSDALVAAKQQQKRVVVQETATWCSPCLSLTRFLNANPVWQKDYIWIKMDHRYRGARELMAEMRDKEQGGIPWFAILDAEGRKLATSNDSITKQNIGYPSSESGQAHFEHMLKSTRLSLTEDEIASLIQALTATPNK